MNVRDATEVMEERLRADLARPADDNLIEWLALLDERDGLNAALRENGRRIDELERWAVRWTDDHGIDQVRGVGGALTVSVKEALRAAYDPGSLDSIRLALVGVSAHPSDLERVEGAVRRLIENTDNDMKLVKEYEQAIRLGLTPGNMHVLYSGFVSSRVERLAADGVELPDGLRLDPYRKVSVRRNPA